ncbi:hypothetical protein DIPPA_16930 [Diplonema papillatum]|nr:hypothetical protein DIPPA_16930 [Diplonema papillatum]
MRYCLPAALFVVACADFVVFDPKTGKLVDQAVGLLFDPSGDGGGSGSGGSGSSSSDSDEGDGGSSGSAGSATHESETAEKDELKKGGGSSGSAGSATHESETAEKDELKKGGGSSQASGDSDGSGGDNGYGSRGDLGGPSYSGSGGSDGLGGGSSYTGSVGGEGGGGGPAGSAGEEGGEGAAESSGSEEEGGGGGGAADGEGKEEQEKEEVPARLPELGYGVELLADGVAPWLDAVPEAEFRGVPEWMASRLLLANTRITLSEGTAVYYQCPASSGGACEIYTFVYACPQCPQMTGVGFLAFMVAEGWTVFRPTPVVQPATGSASSRSFSALGAAEQQGAGESHKFVGFQATLPAGGRRLLRPPPGTQFAAFGIDTQPTPCRSLGSEAACLAPPVGGKCSWDHDDGVCVLRFFEPGVPFAGPSLCTPRCINAAFKQK